MVCLPQNLISTDQQVLTVTWVPQLIHNTWQEFSYLSLSLSLCNQLALFWSKYYLKHGNTPPLPTWNLAKMPMKFTIYLSLTPLEKNWPHSFQEEVKNVQFLIHDNGRKPIESLRWLKRLRPKWIIIYRYMYLC